MTSRKIPLIGWAGLSLSLGLIVSFTGALVLQKWGNTPLSWIWICVCAGITAACLGRYFGLPRWWIPLNGFFPVCVYALLSTDIPAWAYLICFLLLALFYWNSAHERVPLYLSNRTTWQALAEQTKFHEGPFLDLGCGLGGTLFYLASQYPNRNYVGIESAPMPYIYAKVRQTLTQRTNVKILYGNFWNLDLSKYQTVYAFLSPAPMTKLFLKVEAEMPSGGQLISNSFLIPDKSPSETIMLDDNRQTQLHIWSF